MKIKTLTIENFRGFPNREDIHLDGKNLLVYGENGAGKSSIFLALQGLFTAFPDQSYAPAELLMAARNVFVPEDSPVSVSVAFDDGDETGVWTTTAHPTQQQTVYAANPGFSQRILSASLSRSCLDYRSLLDTNYRFDNGDINLFEIVVSVLLADFRIEVDGSWTTIGELWQTTLDARPERHKQAGGSFDAIDSSCEKFNRALDEALRNLTGIITEILLALGQPGITLHTLTFEGVAYNKQRAVEKRGFKNRSIGVELSFYDEPVGRPHQFLNEARLSALALAIYLAGRLACVPADESYTARGATPPFRLLVLDDVLIGLDHSNRLPLLKLLNTRFRDWQIVLLTHDRVWFEMARFEIPDTGSWRCLEIFEGQCQRLDRNGEPVANEDGEVEMIPAPRILDDHYTDLNLPSSLLSQASRFLSQGYLPAAANYTRAAYEATLKVVCHRFGIPVQFQIDQRKMGSDVFHEAIATWLETKPKERKGHLLDAMNQAALFRKMVLNPYSHSLPWKLSKAELEGAMRAVEALHGLQRAAEGVNDQRIAEVRATAIKPAPTVGELEVALAKLSAAFQSRLTSFCMGRVNVPFSDKRPDKKALWAGLLHLSPDRPDAVVNLIRVHSNKTLVESWLVHSPKMVDFTKEILEELLAVVCPGDTGKTVFDL